MRDRTKNKRRKVDTYQNYRRVLKMSHLTNKEIDEMRKHVGLLARTICERVWGRKFY
jgi:hypothetical protein